MSDADDSDKPKPERHSLKGLIKVVFTDKIEPAYCEHCRWREVDEHGQICESCKAEIKELYGLD